MGHIIYKRINIYKRIKIKIKITIIQFRNYTTLRYVAFPNCVTRTNGLF